MDSGSGLGGLDHFIILDFSFHAEKYLEEGAHKVPILAQCQDQVELT